jgi:hypothetical protein
MRELARCREKKKEKDSHLQFCPKLVSSLSQNVQREKVEREKKGNAFYIE